MSRFREWNVAYKSATAFFMESLASGSYTYDQFHEVVSKTVKPLGSFINRTIFGRVDMFEGVPDDLLEEVEEFYDEVFGFYQMLLDLQAKNSIILDNESSEEMIPLELVFTDSGRFINSVWYRVSSDFSKSQERVFYTYNPSSCINTTSFTVKAWSLDARMKSINNTEVRRYPIPLAPTLGLHVTFSKVMSDLVKIFFSKKKYAHINTHEGTYSGSEKFAEFLVSAKVGSTYTLFEQESGVEFVDFLVNGGLADYASSKSASPATLKALSYIIGLSSEVLKHCCLRIFYGQHPLFATCAYVEPEVTTPLYKNYGHLNRQYIGFSFNGKTSDPKIRFSVSMVSSAVSGGSIQAYQKLLPVYLMKADYAVKGKTLGGSPATPDLDAKVQVPPLRTRL